MSSPLTAIYEQVWTTLEADSAFTTAVPACNRIKYHGTAGRDPDPRHNLTSDAIMVRVRPVRSQANLVRDTLEHSLALTLAIEIGTNEKKWSDVLDMCWIIWKAMERLQGDFDTVYAAASPALTYKVISCDPISSDEALDNIRINLGGDMWSSAWTGQITFVVNRTTLLSVSS